MKFFNEEIDFELGPSIGFKSSPGNICTCDLCQYMSINGNWYRISASEREIIKSLENCKSKEEFHNILNSIKKFLI